MTPTGWATTRFGGRRTRTGDAVAVAAAWWLAPIGWVGAMLVLGVVRFGGGRRAGEPLADLRLLGSRAAVVATCLLAVAPQPRTWLPTLSTAVALAVAGRFAESRWAARRDHGIHAGEPTVVVGERVDLERHVRQFVAHPEMGVRPVATAGDPAETPTALPHVGLDELSDVVRLQEASHVVVVSGVASDAFDTQLRALRRAGCRLSVVPPLIDHLTSGAEVIDARGVPMLTLGPRPIQAGPRLWAKRAFDVAVSALAMVLAAPLVVALAAAIKLEDGGPVFFGQKRVGHNGRFFTMWKFRSMVPDAERRKHELVDLNEAEGPFFKMEHDPRVTRVGRLLRRLSIDELPQLFNVLRGEMSLVGPRPILPEEAIQIPEVLSWRISARPGMTGLWQIAGRSWLPTDEGMRMDRAYVEHWNLGLDLRILVSTVGVALRGERRPPVLTDTDLVDLDRRRYAAMVANDDLRPGEPVDVSVVVVAHESAAQIDTCLASVFDAPDEVTREVIVVDNVSTDGTADAVLDGFPRARLIRKRRRDGFATNSNIGSVAANGRHVLMLNPDARLRAGALDSLVDHLDRHPWVGAVGPALVYPDGRPQPSARAFPRFANAVVRRTPLRRVLRSFADGHLLGTEFDRRVRDVDWMLGGALAVRRAALDQVGGFDDGYRLYCEDIDLCWRLHERGWRVQQLVDAVAEHDLAEHTTRKFLTWRTVWHLRSALRFVRLHGLGRPQPVELTVDLPAELADQGVLEPAVAAA